MSTQDYEEALSIWQDVLDDVFNGHTDGLTCPYCGEKTLNVDNDEAKITVRCISCGQWIEGMLAF